MTHDPLRSDTSAGVAELLSPAGDWDCARAAVENGADAVYFGLQDGFNARARAHNFLLADVPKLMAYLHARGVKGYTTLNTLAFSDELPQLEQVVRDLTLAEVDAVLVQDLGLARLVKAISPELAVHASTQMTLTSSECIAAARELGLERVVLPRELSMDEIGTIHRAGTLPLEAFVHGALCVAYSGQCLTSEALGGRSANRGQCAQACRLPYDLICDGEERDLGPVRYLLSPQDLAAYELTPELLAAGVISLKIEGRLKTAEYVANITRHYRRALDAAQAGRAAQWTPRDQQEMELSFSRGFSPGWLEGNDHKQLVPGLSSAKRGILLGTVRYARGLEIEVELHADCAPGDGVVFAADRLAGEEMGGRLFAIYRSGGAEHTPERLTQARAGEVVLLEFATGSIDSALLVRGQQVWKTDDPRLTQQLRATFTQADPVRRVLVDMTVRACVGEPLQLTAHTALGHTATVNSSEPLVTANRHPCTEELLTQQMARLGHTVYQLGQMHAVIEGGPLVPLSVLSRLRQELIAALEVATQVGRNRPLHPEPVLPQLRSLLPDVAAARQTVTDQPPRLNVLVRSLEQLDVVLPLRPARVTVDFADVKEHPLAAERGHAAGVPVWFATPRIQKPGEMGLFRSMLKQGASGVLARNLSAMQFFREAGLPVGADFSLNVTNELTAAFIMSRGAAWLTASYDMNRDQLLELTDHVPAPWLEVVIHQHMPLFHMEHCVFCAVLSPGTNKTNCGRPCDRHTVELRDRVGMSHPLTADVGCRNTLFNAVAQSGAELVPELIARGLRDFRIEFVRDKPAEIEETLLLYGDLLAGRLAGSAVWRTLRAINRVGVTRGTLEERRNPLAIV